MPDPLKIPAYALLHFRSCGSFQLASTLHHVSSAFRRATPDRAGARPLHFTASLEPAMSWSILKACDSCGLVTHIPANEFPRVETWKPEGSCFLESAS